MQRVVGVPTAIAGIIQGVVVLFVLGSEILTEYWPAITFARPKDDLDRRRVNDADASVA